MGHLYRSSIKDNFISEMPESEDLNGYDRFDGMKV